MAESTRKQNKLPCCFVTLQSKGHQIRSIKSNWEVQMSGA